MFAEGQTVEFVDLGLSVKWAKYNIGVKPNQLTKASDWYGNYYAWGEVETKSDYTWGTYKHANGSEEAITKYCNNSRYGKDGYKDELTQLVPEDDAATVTNSAWRMPTQADFEELIALPNQWVNNYDPSKTEHTADDGGIQGLNGRIFTGNGNQLFIPAAGFHFSTYINNAESYGYIWSSSLGADANMGFPMDAIGLKFDLGDINGTTLIERYYGCNVRPVC